VLRADFLRVVVGLDVSAVTTVLCADTVEIGPPLSELGRVAVSVPLAVVVVVCADTVGVADAFDAPALFVASSDCEVPAFDVSVDEPEDDESDAEDADEPRASAVAMPQPNPVSTAAPTPKATASPPTLPTYAAPFMRRVNPLRIASAS
jgi:hypothetical protein